jgi:protein gp37
MGENTAISWCHATFNPWWGCEKVSPACANCYAESWARRVGQELWGASAPRRFFGEAHWAEPLRWNREAEREGARRRVFCASMADVFEGRGDLEPWRQKLWALVEATPWLDWLLLTKRPQNARRMTPWGGTWPRNVWFGTTAENPLWARRRIPELLDVDAVVHFVSCEPLLARLTLQPWLKDLQWVIAGGESGRRPRVMHPDWVRSLRDECQAARVAFHFKQWGEWAPAIAGDGRGARKVVRAAGGPVELQRLGKKSAGRLLDGRTWDEVPRVA